MGLRNVLGSVGEGLQKAGGQAVDLLANYQLQEQQRATQEGFLAFEKMKESNAKKFQSEFFEWQKEQGTFENWLKKKGVNLEENRFEFNKQQHFDSLAENEKNRALQQYLSTQGIASAEKLSANELAQRLQELQMKFQQDDKTLDKQAKIGLENAIAYSKIAKAESFDKGLAEAAIKITLAPFDDPKILEKLQRNDTVAVNSLKAAMRGIDQIRNYMHNAPDNGEASRILGDLLPKIQEREISPGLLQQINRVVGGVYNFAYGP